MKSRILSLIFLSCFLVPLYAQHVTYRSSKHYNEMVAKFERLPRLDSTAIVMLGNSLTENGKDWNNKIEGARHLVNRGIIGDDAIRIYHRLNQICSGHPKAIFFECGINDLSHGLSASKVASDVERTIEAIRQQSPGTRLYVQSLLPINEDFGRWKSLSGMTDVVPVINHLLQDYCSKNDITFINLFDLMKYPENNKMRVELCADGLHLTSKGYEVWAKAIAPYVLELEGVTLQETTER